MSFRESLKFDSLKSIVKSISGVGSSSFESTFSTGSGDGDNSEDDDELDQDRSTEGGGDATEMLGGDNSLVFTYSVKKTFSYRQRSLYMDIPSGTIVLSKGKSYLLKSILNTTKTNTPGCIDLSLRFGSKLKQKTWFFKTDEDSTRFQSYVATLNSSGELLREVFDTIDRRQLHIITQFDIIRCSLRYGIDLSTAEAVAMVEIGDIENTNSLNFKDFVGIFLNTHVASGDVKCCIIEWRNIAAKDIKISLANPSKRRLTASAVSDSWLMNEDDGAPLLVAGEVLLNKILNVRYSLRSTLLKPSIPFALGAMYLTNYRIVFAGYVKAAASLGTQIETPVAFDTITVPIQCISRLDKAVQKREGVAAAIVCKDLRIVRVRFDNSEMETLHQLFRSALTSQAFPEGPNNVKQCFAFTYREVYDPQPSALPALPLPPVAAPSSPSASAAVAGSGCGISDVGINNGWNMFTAHREFSRQGVLQSGLWRLWSDNYTLADTYPLEFVLPAAMGESEVTDAAKYRSKGRLPALTWRNKGNGACLARSSQPMTGLLGNTCLADKLLLNLYRLRGDLNDHSEIENPSDFYIFDCRSPIAATANSALGKGVEDARNYDHAKVIFCCIENIHVMRGSLRALDEAVSPGSAVPDELNYFEKINSSQWLSHIRLLLVGSILVAEKMHWERASVLVVSKID